MKKLFVIIALTLIMSLYAVPVFALETEPGTYFETKILPYIAGGGTAAVASLTGFLSLVRSNKKKADEGLAKLQKASDDLEAKAKVLDETKAIVQAKLAGLNEGVKSFTENANTSMLKMAEMVKAQRETIDGFKNQITAITTNQATTTKALLIGFGNNAELVKNGYAQEICALMKQGEALVEKETVIPKI